MLMQEAVASPTTLPHSGANITSPRTSMYIHYQAANVFKSSRYVHRIKRVTTGERNAALYIGAYTSVCFICTKKKQYDKPFTYAEEKNSPQSFVEILDSFFCKCLSPTHQLQPAFQGQTLQETTEMLCYYIYRYDVISSTQQPQPVVHRQTLQETTMMLCYYIEYIIDRMSCYYIQI